MELGSQMKQTGGISPPKIKHFLRNKSRCRPQFNAITKLFHLKASRKFQRVITSLERKTLVTVVVTVNACDNALPSMFVFSPVKFRLLYCKWA